MKAFVLAAGVGSRMGVLTATRPKALVEIGGKPLVYWVLTRLHLAGIQDVVINVHHHAGLLIAYLEKNQWEGMRIHISDERTLLLNTGGGLKQAAPWLAGPDPVLVHNVDILTDINIPAMLSQHLQSRALATLAVRERPSARQLLWDRNGQLTGWRDIKNGQEKWVQGIEESPTSLAFSGVHIISPAIFSMMPESKRFSIIDLYLALAKNNLIQAYPHDAGIWMDIGTPASWEKANQFLSTPEGIRWQQTYLSRF